MHRISAWTVTLCTLVVLSPILVAADTIPPPVQPTQCTDVIRTQNIDSKTGLPTNTYTTYVKNPETTSQKKLTALQEKCEDGKIYTIVQEQRPKVCSDAGEVVQSYRIEWRWQDGVKAADEKKPPGRIEFTMISAKGDRGTKVSTKCVQGQSVTDSAKADPQFIPFAKGATEEGVYKALELQKKDQNGIQKALSNNKAYTDQLKADFDATKNPTEAQKTELVRALEDQKILNDIAAEKDAIGAGEAARRNRELDADLKGRLTGYSDPKTWGHYYEQTPTTVQQQKTVSALEDQQRQKMTGFDQNQYEEDTVKNKNNLQNAYNKAKEDYDKCMADTTWYNYAFSCGKEKNELDSRIDDARAGGCSVGWRYTVDCDNDIETGSTPPGTKVPPTPEQKPSTKPPPDDGKTASCAAAESTCQKDVAARNFNSTACQYHANNCRGGNPPPGDPGNDPRRYDNPPPSQQPPGQSQQPGGNPGSSNPNGYNGLSQQDQQMLERQCFDYGNASACAALQRYCQQTQNQNQNQSLGGIGQYLPIITSLISGGGNLNSLGNLGNLGGGGMSQQQCENLDKSISNSMCRQYPGTQFTNGRCECPNNGQWDGTRCPTQNQCSQYPGTVFTNGTCQCPSGQQWDGARCSGSGAQELEAELACSPPVADINETSIAVSWQCRGADTSKGDGFNTNGSKTGSATTKLKSTDLNEDATNVDLILTCTKESNTKTAVCPLEINRPFLVAVATYSKVPRGDTTTIGWIAKGMKDGDDACKMTSDKHSDFSHTGRDVVLTTPPIQEKTTFTVKCTTKGGITKTAQVVVDIE